MPQARSVIRGSSAGALAALAAILGMALVWHVVGLACFVVALGLVLAAGAGNRTWAWSIAAVVTGIARAVLLLVDPVRPDDGWLHLLAAESLAGAAVAIRWPLHGTTVLCVSTCLHRWRVVDLGWNPNDLPLAIAYTLIAIAALAASLTQGERSNRVGR